ncbi:TPA: hypothetical protein VAW45_000443 [Streptococcus agalactiae]|uniref:hypothetical protein n=1 Tax=Streptococcus agalactiae TaxID=1311 RepID=UPI0002BC6E52|nr:hypothetical protein [Streptococcus agalactiae]EPU21443.1 hypothetical protein SAG0135_03490 [Streptococcus agalactiae LMG 14609]EPU28664.1 hypothetical protein SAG0146_02695 [Streptococcus agalactiae MRI Z1-039]AIX04803.1 glycerophosphoryl diester phosphodiesterase family protein [Streptococcus agalactiae CNCTC 10/84]EPT54724.1 hypothetical protein SAG0053_00530 [Streptococcus agalactiae CCUG 25532]EPT85337.1 hypothetical protein SAG0099_02005 [Streptococcus agalactiae BSU247]
MNEKKLSENIEESKKITLEIEKVSDELNQLKLFENDSVDFFDQTQKVFSDLSLFQKTVRDMSDFEAIRSDYQRLQNLVFIDIDDFKDKLLKKKNQLIQKQDNLYYERQKLQVLPQEKVMKVGEKNGKNGFRRI